MQEDNPMKKAFQRIIPILTAVILSVCLALPASAYDVDYGSITINVDNAPNGTAYVDILVPESDIPSEHSTTHDYEVSVSNKSDSNSGETKLNITADSEISKYTADGYVSLMAHTNMVYSCSSDRKDKNGDYICVSCSVLLTGSYAHQNQSGFSSGVDLMYLDDKFSDMKAAYIDEKGNVLAVTSAYSTGHGKPYGFRVDGDSLKLVLDDHESNGWVFIASASLFVVIPILCVAILIIIVFRNKKRSK